MQLPNSRHQAAARNEGAKVIRLLKPLRKFILVSARTQEGKAISPDYAKMVHSLHLQGKSVKAIATDTEKSPDWVRKVLRDYLPSGKGKVGKNRGLRRIDGMDNKQLLEVFIDYERSLPKREN